MPTPLRRLEELPRQNATQVKNKWGDVLRQVQQAGTVAVTSHSTIEMVMVDATVYQGLLDRVAALQAREEAALGELESRFNARLAVLQKPDARRKADAVLDGRGKLAKRPRAGATF